MTSARLFSARTGPSNAIWSWGISRACGVGYDWPPLIARMVFYQILPGRAMILQPGSWGSGFGRREAETARLRDKLKRQILLAFCHVRAAVTKRCGPPRMGHGGPVPPA